MVEAKFQRASRTGWFKEFGKALEAAVVMSSALALVVGFALRNDELGESVAAGPSWLQKRRTVGRVAFRFLAPPWKQATPSSFCAHAAMAFLLEWGLC
jgi:hypothetical protein